MAWIRRLWRQFNTTTITTIGVFLLIVKTSACHPSSVQRTLKSQQPEEGQLNNQTTDSLIDSKLINYIDRILTNTKSLTIIPGVTVERISNTNNNNSDKNVDKARSSHTIEEYIGVKLDEYARTHAIAVNLPETARLLIDTGKSSFLTGFGMGFMAFALKKLLLPFFIGAQLLKSVLIAMFLPSIIGTVGKLLGKGLSTFSGISGASAGINNQNQQAIEDFEFKDTSPYNNNDEPGTLQEYQGDTDAVGLNVGTSSSTTTATPNANSRYGFGSNRISYMNNNNDNYYMRKPAKKTDYKVFHKIPSSSLLLTSYDPFYSPLLSRLDAVFQQLGLGNDKSPQIEKCRERLVCLMYANPAKYAPYSNLVSAQLSRELNELRKPSTDNPDILRFFRYMKAAKDGQDGGECLAQDSCPLLNQNQPSPAILTTYNEINKLVQARKLN